MNKSELNKKAEDYAKDVLGEDQFKENKSAVKSIKNDFKAGFAYAKEIYTPCNNGSCSNSKDFNKN